jgi:hypothetical protein
MGTRTKVPGPPQQPRHAVSVVGGSWACPAIGCSCGSHRPHKRGKDCALQYLTQLHSNPPCISSASQLFARDSGAVPALFDALVEVLTGGDRRH